MHERKPVLGSLDAGLDLLAPPPIAIGRGQIMPSRERITDGWHCIPQCRPIMKPRMALIEVILESFEVHTHSIYCL